MRRLDGFSLLEILVAFSIMAIALTIVLRVFGNGVNHAGIAEEYTIAVQIAESLMARTGVETALEPGELDGNEGERFDWRVSVQPVQNSGGVRESLRKLADGDQEPAAQLMRVNVTVAWGDDEQRRTVELDTLKLTTAQ